MCKANLAAERQSCHSRAGLSSRPSGGLEPRNGQTPTHPQGLPNTVHAPLVDRTANVKKPAAHPGCPGWAAACGVFRGAQYQLLALWNDRAAHGEP
jgi:hypothetical protein